MDFTMWRKRDLFKDELEAAWAKLAYLVWRAKRFPEEPEVRFLGPTDLQVEQTENDFHFLVEPDESGDFSFAAPEILLHGAEPDRDTLLYAVGMAYYSLFLENDETCFSRIGPLGYPDYILSEGSILALDQEFVDIGKSEDAKPAISCALRLTDTNPTKRAEALEYAEKLMRQKPSKICWRYLFQGQLIYSTVTNQRSFPFEMPPPPPRQYVFAGASAKAIYYPGYQTVDIEVSLRGT